MIFRANQPLGKIYAKVFFGIFLHRGYSYRQTDISLKLTKAAPI